MSNLANPAVPVFDPGPGNVTAPPLLFAASDSTSGTQLIGGHAVRSDAGAYVETRFGTAPLLAAPGSRVSELNLNNHWPSSPDIEHLGGAMVTTGDRVAYLALVYPVVAGGNAVLLGALPPNGGTGMPSPVGPFDDRPGLEPTGDIALAVEGDTVTAVWKERSSDGTTFTLANSFTGSSSGVDVDGFQGLVSTGGPLVLAPRADVDEVVYYDPVREISGRLPTPGRMPEDRVAGAWRERDGAPPQLLIAWSQGTSMMLVTTECDLTMTVDACSVTGSSEVVFENQVWNPAMVSLPSGSVVAAQTTRSVGGDSMDEVILFSFNESGDFFVKPGEVFASTYTLDSYGPGFVADIAATSFTEGDGRTHMVFGVLSNPGYATGTYIYRIEGCIE